MTPLELAAMVDRLTPRITEGPWEYREEQYCPAEAADSENIRTGGHGLSAEELEAMCPNPECVDCETHQYVVGAADGVWAHNPPFWEVTTEDMQAAALVPDLMAENQRMRRELETLRDMYDALATGECAVAYQHRNSRDAITRILEGETQ